MPGRATGNAREAACAEALDALGYHCISLKGSGARGARMRRRKNPVVGDILALRDRESSPFYPWLQVSVGAHSAIAAFRELQEHPLPGFTPICVLYVYRAVAGQKTAKKRIVRRQSRRASRRIYVDAKTWFSNYGEALLELQARR